MTDAEEETTDREHTDSVNGHDETSSGVVEGVGNDRGDRSDFEPDDSTSSSVHDVDQIEEESTFLLSEEPLESVDEDKFGHEAYVDTLEEIIYRVDPPWHIGLYGTWGSGKSTIVDLLYQRIRASQADDSSYREFDDDSTTGGKPFENVLCVGFDAWKHAEGSVRTELLLDLNQSLGEELERRFGRSIDTVDEFETDPAGDDSDRDDRRRALHGRSGGVLSSETLIEELYDVSEIRSEGREPVGRVIRNLDTFHFVAVFVLAVVASLLVLPTRIEAPMPSSLWILPVEPFAGLPWNWIASILIGVLALIASSYLDMIFEDFRDARRDVRKTRANPQKEWSGAYENLFESLIDETNERYREFQDTDRPADIEKIVITIDDLDRCSSETVYEILIALKSFFKHEKCIYIIPCDEDALYKHLEAADDGNYLGDTRTQQNFLAKFFETELEIPPPSQRRLENYFGDRVERMDHSFSQQSLDVLYDAQLRTPRRITRTLNRVATLEKLAETRGVLDPTVESRTAIGDEETHSDFRTAEVDGADATEPVDDGTAYSSGDWEDDEAGRAFLAVIAVLQKDFPRLHAELETDPYLLDEIYAELETDPSTNPRTGLARVLDKINVPQERRDALISFLIDVRSVIGNIDDPEPYLRLSGTDRNRTETFQARFDRGSTGSVRDLITDAREGTESNVSAGSANAEESSSGDGSTEIREFANYVVRRVEEDTTDYQSLVTAIRIAGTFPLADQRDIAEAVLGAIQESEGGSLLSGIEFDLLEPILSSLPQERRIQFLDYYMQSIIDDGGINEENFASLLEAPGELFDDIAVQEAFVETIRNGRQQGLITPEEYAKILADIREYKPELYTPELVGVKL